jgi:hypothetical protein
MSTAFPWVTNWSLLFYFYPVASQGIGLLDPVFTSCMVGLKGTRSNLTELYSSISNRSCSSVGIRAIIVSEVLQIIGQSMGLFNSYVNRPFELCWDFLQLRS